MIIDYIKKNKHLLFMLFLIIALVLPFFIIAFYNYYSADDYFYALNIIERGFFIGQKTCYEVVNGRYTTTFYLSILPLAFGYDSLAFISPVFILSLLIFSVYYFSKYIIYNQHIKYKLLLVFIILIPFLSLINNPAESIYWASGAASYGLSICFFFLFLGSISKLLFIDNSRKVVLFCIISLILLIGSNETITIIVNFILLMVFLFDLILKRKINFKLVLIGLIGIVFTILVIKSPGNLVRLKVSQEMFNYTIKENFSYNSNQILDFMWEKISLWQDNQILNFCDVLLLLMLIKFNLKDKKLYKNFLWFYILIIFITLFISLFPIYYTLGIGPPTRTHELFLIFYILSNFFIVFLVYNVLSKFIKNFDTKKLNLLIAGMVLAVVFQVLTTTNIVRSAYAVLFTNELQQLNYEVITTINSVKKSTTKNCVVNNVYTRPALLFRDNLDEIDSNYFANSLLANYYQKNSVKVRPFKGNVLDARIYNFDVKNTDIVNNIVASDFSVSKNNATVMKNNGDYAVTINIPLEKIPNYKKINGLEISFKILAEDSTYTFETFFYINNIKYNYIIYNYIKYFKSQNYVSKTWVDVKYNIFINKKNSLNTENKIVFFAHSLSKSALYIDDLQLKFME